MDTFTTTLPKGYKIEALIDTDATFSKFSTELLNKLGMEPSFKTTVVISNGKKITRKEGKSASVPVMFGKKGEHALVGVTTLEFWV
ncbi:MAG: hypothetical protein QME68_00800 [Elusimicrobiota bacterium]|nr:hypothetical protein [Elusimicrobiota bacterium]